MSREAPSKDEALEALDFIVNVLKEHEKDLDRLINELGTVAEQIGDAGELSGKVEKIEHKINTLQNDIGGLINNLSTSPREVPVAPSTTQTQTVTQAQLNESQPAGIMQGLPIILRCKQWEDFQALAAQAQTVSFTFNEAEKNFQADVLKNNHVISYNGELPKISLLLKIWLSKQLEVNEKRILEGALILG